MMSELERLDEAIEQHYQTNDYNSGVIVREAARAYRDLLANGPDYEAALNVLIQEDSNNARGLSMSSVRKAVDASVYPKEAENE